MTLIAALASGAVLGMSACGSGDTTSTTTPTRGASSETACPVQKSAERYITVTNGLRTNLTLDVPRASWTCDGFSGTATPGEIDGLRIGSTSGVMRLEMVEIWKSTASKAAFGMRIRAGTTTVANVTLQPYLTSGMERRLGIVMDGSPSCGTPVESGDASGTPVWVQVLCGKGAKRDNPWELQITDTRPS